MADKKKKHDEYDCLTKWRLHEVSARLMREIKRLYEEEIKREDYKVPSRNKTA